MSQLSFIEKGKNHEITVVLLHGYCERKEVWNEFIDQLSQTYHVLAPDLPGFGENPALTSSISITEMSKQMFNWLNIQGIEKGILIGHSLGGYISLAFTEQYPEWVQGLCIFQSTALADDEAKKEKRTQTAAFIDRNGMGPFAGPFVRNLFFNPDLPHLKPIVETLTEVAANTSDKTAIEVSYAMRDRPKRLHVLANATFPILFIAGKNDTAVPLGTLSDQFLLPQGVVSICILPDTGHMAMFEKAEESMKAIQSWLETT